jgi:hypothetical protein
MQDQYTPPYADPIRDEAVRWRAKWVLKKYFDAKDEEDVKARNLQPDEVHISDGNALTYGGASVMWEALIGNGTVTAGQALTYFNNAQAAIGVGDSSTAAAASQTNLQASTNKLRVGMSSTYPQHTDATTSGGATITFQSSFSSGQANYAWNEVGVFSSTTDGVGRMLNRLAPSGGYGTKASGGTWTLQISLTLS